MTLGIVFLVMGGTLSMVLRREGGKVEGEQWELPQMLVLGRGSIFFFGVDRVGVWGGGERGAPATASRAGLGEAGSGVGSAGWGSVAACGEKVGMGTEHCRGVHEYGSVYYCSLLCFNSKLPF